MLFPFASLCSFGGGEGARGLGFRELGDPFLKGVLIIRIAYSIVVGICGPCFPYHTDACESSCNGSYLLPRWSRL